MKSVLVPVRRYGVLALVLACAACAGDDGPTTPENPVEPDTPAIPTITRPGDQLPDRSEFLAVEIAPLQNLSPDLAGYSAAGLAQLNEATVLDFRWADRPSPDRRLIFADGRPRCPDGLQFSESYGWYNLACGTANWPFVPLGEFGGSDYYVCTAPTRWMYADATCRALGGHLAAVTSADEQSFLLDALAAVHPGTHFIGLTDWGRANNDWFWTSGEPVDRTSWHPGEPNNHDGEQFVVMYGTGTWNDVNIGAAWPYVLELDRPLVAPCPDPVPCLRYEANQPLFLDALAGASVPPHVQRRVYWKKIFQISMDEGNEYTYEYAKSHGVSESNGMSFGWSIGISVSASWGFVSASIETEFHQDFHREVTVSDEEVITQTYHAQPAPAGKVKVVALWQLRERYVITDDQGREWQDPRFELAAPLPYLDQGLEQEHMQTLFFDAR